uniref:Uncharacterized protein n=1 Tax=Romanomermis culicivorax TaxID=13658 RepID=A0A915KQU2_ROMCU
MSSDMRCERTVPKFSSKRFLISADFSGQRTVKLSATAPEQNKNYDEQKAILFSKTALFRNLITHVTRAILNTLKQTFPKSKIYVGF